MVDRQTIDVYDAKAGDYANLVAHEKPDAQLQAFMDLLPAGAAALDLGCGPGHSALLMQNAGFFVDPVDASPAMVEIAVKQLGLPARVMTFDGLDAVAAYDGVWANFSLLHADRADLPKYLTAIARSLRPEGVFHIGMKTGAGAKRDGIGRMYTYVTADELLGLLDAAGFAHLATDTGRERGLDGVMADWVVMRARKAADA